MALSACVLALAAAPAYGAITVTTTKDETIAGDGSCSLREAIAAAGGQASPDCPRGPGSGASAITLPRGIYKLSLGSELEIVGSTSIQGAGAALSTIDANGHGRVLSAAAGITVAISGVTITGGRAQDGSAGVNGNASAGQRAGAAGGLGERGGGIFNLATMSLTDVELTGNTAGRGGAGGDGGAGATTPCAGADSGCGGGGGDGGSGGGIFNAGTLTLTRVTVSGNRAGDGGAGGTGGGASSGSASNGGDGGSGGDGGGVYNSGMVTSTDSTISDNATGNGGSGGAGGAGTVSASGGVGGTGGGGGQGGAIDNQLDLAVSGSTLSGNATGNGGDGGDGGAAVLGDGAIGGPGGLGGAGGAILLSDPSAAANTISATTIATNTTGDGGYGGAGGSGGGVGAHGGGGGVGGTGGAGAAIDDVLGELTLSSATVSANVAGGGGGGGSGGVTLGGSLTRGQDGGQGAGGSPGGIALAVAIPNTGITEQDALVASNTPRNCAGAITDAGHNLSFPDATCPHAVTGDPQLGPLAANGGSTQTLALGAHSAAIDQVPAAGAGCRAADQRGVSRPRPVGGACDIGAYEFAPPACRDLAATTTPARPVRLALSCGDPAGVALNYLIDRRPAHGSLGPLDSVAGTLTYTPNATFGGVDSFSYHASDSNGTAGKQTVTITVSRVPPVISRLRLAHRRFRVGKGRTALLAAKRRPAAGPKAATGTRFQFDLSAAARVQITIMRTSGPKKQRKTVGTLVRGSEPQGADEIAFSDRLGGRGLAAGSYKATLLASNVAGQSRARTVAFAIVRR